MTWTPELPPTLVDGGPVAIDFEYRGDPSGRLCTPFAFSVYSPLLRRGWYVPWGHKGGGNLDEAACKDWFVSNLRNRDCYGLNIKADLHAATQWGVDCEALGIRPHDVAHMSALLQENRITSLGYFGFSLEALAEHYLPEGDRKIHPVGIEPENFGTVHSSLLAERGISDARLTWLLAEALLPDIEDENLRDVLALEDRCIYPVVGMERSGFKLDRAKLEKWSVELPLRVKALQKKILDDTGIAVTPGGRKCMTALFNWLDIAVPERLDEETNVWKETFDEEHMKTVDHPTIKDVLAMRKLASLHSKFVGKFLLALDDTDHVHFQLHQLRMEGGGEGEAKGTVTGRFSSGGGEWRINIQQVSKGEKQEKQFKWLGLPPEFMTRELFLPDSGMLAASDADQIEFRIFAHFAKNPHILQLYKDDPAVDFHMAVTRLMNPHVTDQGELDKLRSDMKNNNFGVLYGMGRYKLSIRLGLGCTCGLDWLETDHQGDMVRWFQNNASHREGCPAREANTIMDRYHEEFPDASRLLKKAADMAERDGFVRTILGRRRRFGKRDKKFYKALNSIIQGTAADYFKLKLCLLWENRQELGIVLRAPVHDEFVFDVPSLSHLRKVHNLLMRQEYATLRVPLTWSTGFGINWFEAGKE